jgi:hypothetical protein
MSVTHDVCVRRAASAPRQERENLTMSDGMAQHGSGEAPTPAKLHGRDVQRIARWDNALGDGRG